MLYDVLLLCAGNDNLYLLLSWGLAQRLRVDLADFKGNTRYAEYDAFTINSGADKYRLAHLGSYTGTAGKKLNIRPTVIYYINLLIKSI